ncbi:hypothetical protein [uncultured Ilyobacter sp.]|uniref:hypothetical protein n=1 Tax=uncultured Ilyobacter sp. TaxID=544433 RepID=UPI0029C8CF6F|nr:hypothetical protein [uncultured Ilyobacter sp.]
MEQILEQIAHISALNHFFITMLILITMVLVSRTFVAGTKYSSILLIVVFGLAMGFLLVKSEMATPGLVEFPMVVLASRTTVIALIASFFVGGQEIKKILFKEDLKIDDIMIPSKEETILGTNSTQIFFLIRAFFILIGIQTTHSLIIGVQGEGVLGQSYMLLAYLSIVLSIIFIDNKAKIASKQSYIRKGLVEIVGILAVLMLSLKIATVIKPVIALPQIFFAMLISAGLGMVFSNWKFGPTLNSLLFAGIPIVLAGSFLVGGSRMADAFQIAGVKNVMIYGFAGQVFWMFSGLAILIFLCKANNVRNLAPGMAGALSHSGLTGACTGGDLGEKAASRAPIMINIPFFGHIFVFSILAASAKRGSIIVGWTLPLICVGLVIVAFAVATLRKADGDDGQEVKGLMQFAFGWQVIAVFGSFTMLNMAGMPLDQVSIAVSSALSHFGLFAAVQGGMFGGSAAALIAFIFAMPFLVHPLVFGMFGKAAENEGKMSSKIVLGLTVAGFIGVVYSLMTI